MNSADSTQLNTPPITLIDNKGRLILIDRPMIAGREEGCDLLLDEGRCSRKHATLSPTADGLLIEDTSSNGTFLNGNRIDKSAIAKAGDEIAFDTDVRFRVQGEKPAAADVTMLAPAPMVAKALAAEAVPPPAPAAAVTPAPEPAAPAESASAINADTSTDEETGEGSKKAWWAAQDAGPDGTMLMKPVSVDHQAAIEGTTVMNALRSNEPSLVGLSPSVKGKVYKFNGERWKIGRDAECDIIIEDAGVSALHAQIINEGDTWKLINLMSSNGSFVNGQRVQSAYLNSGDRLQFGAAEFLFNLSGIKATTNTFANAPQETVQVKTQGAPIWLFVVAGLAIAAALGAFLLFK